MLIPALSTLCAEKLVELGEPIPAFIHIVPRPSYRSKIVRQANNLTQESRILHFRRKEDALAFLMIARDRGIQMSDITRSTDFFQSVVLKRRRCKCELCKYQRIRGESQWHAEGTHRVRRVIKIPLYEIRVYARKVD